MRWDALFEDLEGQMWAEERLSLEAEISERARVESAALVLSDRLRGSLGQHVTAGLVTGALVEGTLAHAGAEALVLNEGRHQVLVPYAAVTRYGGLGRLAHVERSTVRKALGMASSLRAMARDRSELAVSLLGQEATPAVYGVMDRVGRDYFDLAVVPRGEARRRDNVSGLWTVPFTALVAIRSQRDLA
ncbi:hypothetical protein V1639_06145 [Pseudarthrobacter sp. J75]|uniref:hypothetical protein n=1 Tax=unclassified Pseudarthrobacter TaxID=2647000 RepID=UPI002E8101C4|nr:MULTISPECIES: hypothetical protein [unclassified Pseudarthrobacter]MEE2521378.1 hypothetical protein [Pseudarthrobacter sp. J47]MEE2528610.1 hypothetical protein [Pseudarthrobacter sp. J75]